MLDLDRLIADRRDALTPDHAETALLGENVIHAVVNPRGHPTAA
jgi:hypothetical protein